jgi:hypothetical protein
MFTHALTATTRRIPRFRLLAGIASALAVGATGYAYTASNTVPASTAGSGQGGVSGYTISNLHYALNATSPANIDSLTFGVSPVIPSTSNGKAAVQAQLTVGGPTGYTCTTNTAGDTVTCATTTPQLTAETLTGLIVVAAQ